MSVNFFENFSKIANDQNVIRETPIVNNKKVIHHANHVVFSNGEYKGYLGFVYNIDQPFYRVEVPDRKSVV